LIIEFDKLFVIVNPYLANVVKPTKDIKTDLRF
jgi:hypothetical protein